MTFYNIFGIRTQGLPLPPKYGQRIIAKIKKKRKDRIAHYFPWAKKMMIKGYKVRRYSWASGAYTCNPDWILNTDQVGDDWHLYSRIPLPIPKSH